MEGTIFFSVSILILTIARLFSIDRSLDWERSPVLNVLQWPFHVIFSWGRVHW
jgi:hypothetical protein